MDVGDCKLGEGDVGLLSKFLFSCKDLDDLSIGHASFGTEGLGLVAKFLGKKINVTSFALVSVTINKECKAILAKSLAVRNRSARPLTSLCLRSNEMDLPAVIRGTKNGLQTLDNLTSLELSNNRLPVAGAKVLAKVLQTNPALTTLNLSGNRLTNKGARDLLAPLKDEGATLNHLDISNNWISKSLENFRFYALDITLRLMYFKKPTRLRQRLWKCSESITRFARWISVETVA